MSARRLATLLVLAVAVAGCTGGQSAPRQLQPVVHDPGPGLAGVGTLPAPASAWPQSGYDARHSSATAATGPKHGRVKWSVKLGGNATPGPVIAADGSILAATNAGRLDALDPATGKIRWSFDGGGSYGQDLSTSPAVLAGGIILWPGSSDTLFALSGKGKLLWKEEFDGEVLSPAVAGADRVYVADVTGFLVAFEITPTTHRQAWSMELGGDDFASPTVGPDGTIYSAAGSELVAVRDLGTSGAERWRFHAKAPIEVSNPVSAAGIVVLGTNNDAEYGVRTDGSLAWKIPIGDNTYSSAVVRPDGTAWFGDNSGQVRILNSANGNVLHAMTPLGRAAELMWSQVVVDSAGDGYWIGTSGTVWGYDRDGHQILRLKLDSRSNCYPAMGADGTLYVGTNSGTFYAID